ncbi:DNA mismatch repair endonuclease MutL [Paenibacillus lutrae]|uniref:DNA mismatch repair protein MutL n=1 Tax=Paenibacillus lutrae TaxID=2078573 RepID=A0A7X3FIJ3_9BACL|nr:DNA mismatch repair endonuclease MutL [Paenibacillus lutrae]MVP00436.1 DNA mismatch repair endonuclease MutL [Paenibacillus lutrae]
MGKIRLLDEHIANQIAAGEVVERPASVVKELVENSIDAGSSRIDVIVEEGGLQLIRVTDNGAGIEGEDCEMAFFRHATSKINSGKDLFSIRTLGFRGEALPSIAAVSKTEVITATDGSGLGRKLAVEGGHVAAHEEAAARKGTDISVKELFYNTPARLKYMKTIQTELGHISDYMYRLSLAHPDIAFTLKHNGNTLLQTLGKGDLLQVIAGVYGSAVGKQMLPVEEESLDYKINGYISRPELNRANRSAISIIINGRYVRSFAVQHAIMNGYHTLLPINRFPVVILHIEMDPSLVDVNVHPSKLEVRFSKEPELIRMVEDLIKQALGQQVLIPKGVQQTARIKESFVQETMTLYRPEAEPLLQAGTTPAKWREQYKPDTAAWDNKQLQNQRPAPASPGIDPQADVVPGPPGMTEAADAPRPGQAERPQAAREERADAAGGPGHLGGDTAPASDGIAAGHATAGLEAVRSAAVGDSAGGAGDAQDAAAGSPQQQRPGSDPASSREHAPGAPTAGQPMAGAAQRGLGAAPDAPAGQSTDASGGASVPWPDAPPPEPPAGLGGGSGHEPQAPHRSAERRMQPQERRASQEERPFSREAAGNLMSSLHTRSDKEALRRPDFPSLAPIGQLHGTYLLAQNEAGLYMIDQHAAHERINYEYYYTKFGEPQEASQELLVPIPLEFTSVDFIALQEKLPLLEQVGVYLEAFGGNTYLVRAYPHWFPAGDEQSIVEEMCEWILTERKGVDLSKLREKSSTLCSCKASIKANQSLSTAEMEALLDRLGSCMNPYTCPHGRPVVISFSTYELEKMFKRVM